MDSINTKVNQNFVLTISNTLEDIVIESLRLTQCNGMDEYERDEVNIFNAKKPPTIKIKDYLTRIMTYSKCEESTVIYSLILIDLLCEKSQLNSIKI